MASHYQCKANKRRYNQEDRAIIALDATNNREIRVFKTSIIKNEMDGYYEDENVRERLIEYAGGFNDSGPTCAYFSQCDGDFHSEEAIRHSSDLDWFLEEGKEVARSICDSESLLVHLDVEYVNFDSPIRVFTDPGRAFEIQQPVIDVIEEVLLKWGITPLHLVTGQGHHFVWSVPRHSAPERTLARLAPAQDWMKKAYRRTTCRIETANCTSWLRPFTGLGMVMEYFANEVKKIASERTPVTVDTTAVISGPRALGKAREIISLDISEYGDPIHTRMIRMPFSRYMKQQRTWISSLFDRQHRHSDMFVLPLHEMGIREAIAIRQNEKAVRDLAKRASVRIPDESRGMNRLLSEYLASPLRKFHEKYYQEKQHPEERWSDTYALADLSSLPSCVRWIIENPNDSLLKPAGIQMVVRSLLAEGWHPRHIAGFITFRFHDPIANWGDAWIHYDPGVRAEFYTRLFAGQVATGIDKLIDYNCISSKEKDLCRSSGENCSLASLCEKLNSNRTE